jgi:transcriptional regulator with XRE-family HTH domain
MSLRRVAEEARIDVGHLSRVERGAAGLSLAGLRRLASVLGLRELDGMLEQYTPAAAAADKVHKTRPRTSGGTAAADRESLEARGRGTARCSGRVTEPSLPGDGTNRPD